jgi:glycosyltransferase involved in cell wall biosynthesis
MTQWPTCALVRDQPAFPAPAFRGAAPLISAIIPTFNRADLLIQAVDSLVHQSLAPEQYEIIVVDNRSTDQTRSQVMRRFGQVRNFRYIFEPDQGVSAARNRGWRAASADLLAFLDDDAIANPDWLAQYLDAFASAPTAPGCVGGRIEPIWQSPRPAWLPDDLLWCYSLLDHAAQPTALRGPVFPPAANVAFLRRALEQVGGFTLNVGRSGGNLVSGEETLAIRQMLHRGFTCLYWPAACVRHWVPSERLTAKWLARRMYWEGVSCALSRRLVEPISRGRRLKLAACAVWKVVQSPDHRRALLSRRWAARHIKAKAEAWGCLGEAAGLLGLAD